jgi:16S rRNA (cytosine967-C5)-methyltransferase
MSISPARIAAFEILLRVAQRNAYASELLNSSRYAKLSPADHGLATELVMGVLRWQSVLDDNLAPHLSKKLVALDTEVLIALRIAAYQMLFLDRIPARAAVHESVELMKLARKRSAAPFVNAVLRKVVGPSKQRSWAEVVSQAKTAGALAQQSAHPVWLVERWQREFGFERAQQICACDQQAPQIAIALDDSEMQSRLEKENVQLAPGLLLASARRVIGGDLTNTRSVRDDRILIQDEASQLVAHLVGEGSKILDCCAAPGGKTRALARKNPSAAIVAVELHPHRARLLRKLVAANNVEVIVADARDLPVRACFDRVLADVPCSGTGTLARNPEIKWRLKPEDLVDLQARQVAILKSSMQRATPGGRIVYATCSLEKEENNDVVEQALAADSSFRRLDCRVELEHLRGKGQLVWKDVESITAGPYLRTMPGVHPCDGFFAAVLEKI